MQVYRQHATNKASHKQAPFLTDDRINPLIGLRRVKLIKSYGQTNK